MHKCGYRTRVFLEQQLFISAGVKTVVPRKKEQMPSRAAN